MKRVCKNGHDTLVLGRYKRGGCKLCTRARAKRYFYANKDLCHKRNKNYLLKNADKVSLRKIMYRKSNLHREDLWKRQGITLTLLEYNEMKQAQKSLCLICKKLESGKQQLNVDHCHKTGRIRGLICHKCNKGLGCFNEDKNILLEAVRYLTPEMKQLEVI